MAESQVITEEAKEKILQADIANIVRKVKAGKPLSSIERKIISESISRPTGRPKEYALSWPVYPNQKAFAAEGIVPLPLIKAECKSGNPGWRNNRLYAKEFLTYLIGRLIAGDGAAALKVLNLEQEQAAATRERKLILEMKRAEMLRDLLSRDLIIELATPAGQQARSGLMDLPERLAPVCNPTSPATAFDALTVWRDQHLEELSALFDTPWTKENIEKESK